MTDRPEKPERDALSLFPECEETVPLKYLPCVDEILKIKTELYFLY